MTDGCTLPWLLPARSQGALSAPSESNAPPLKLVAVADSMRASTLTVALVALPGRPSSWRVGNIQHAGRALKNQSVCRIAYQSRNLAKEVEITKQRAGFRQARATVTAPD